jgi:hypothetical protein
VYTLFWATLYIDTNTWNDLAGEIVGRYLYEYNISFKCQCGDSKLPGLKLRHLKVPASNRISTCRVGLIIGGD